MYTVIWPDWPWPSPQCLQVIAPLGPFSPGKGSSESREKACPQNWITTIVTLSAGAIGLLVTLLTTVGVTSRTVF